MARIFVLMRSDIARCPRGSFLPQHYREDGSCRCAEDPAVKAEIEALRSERRVLLDRIRDLEKKL